MTPFKFVRWVRSLSQSRGKTYQKRPRLRLKLEELENRLAPATHTWTGGGGVNNPQWTNPANWSGGAPIGGVNPDSDGQFPDLVFPAVAAGVNKVTLENLPGTPIIKSITISADNYIMNVGGSQIILSDPSATPATSAILVNNGALNAVINFDIQLGGPPTGSNQQFFTVGAGSDLTLTGKLSSSANTQLTKEGNGLLTLVSDDSFFLGSFTLDTSGGIVKIKNVNSLGNGNNPAGITVGTNAQLQLDLGAGGGTVNGLLTLNGPGIANDGALLNVSGNNTWAGNVVLDSATSALGVVIGANGPVAPSVLPSSLNISGKISDKGSGQNLTKVGTNQIILSNDNTYRGVTTINNGVLTIEAPFALGTSAQGTIVNYNPPSQAGQPPISVGTLQLAYDNVGDPLRPGDAANGILQARPNLSTRLPIPTSATLSSTNH